MKYNYNRLWKMLIDKSMTKTEMRKQKSARMFLLKWVGVNRCQWKALRKY